MNFKDLVKVALAALTCFIAINTHANSLQSDSVNVNFNIKGIYSSMPYVTVFGNTSNCNLSIKACEKIQAVRVREVPEKSFTIFGSVSEPVVLRLSFSNDRKLLKQVGMGFIPTKCSNLWLIVSPQSNFTVEGDLYKKDFCDLYPSNDDENTILAKFTSKAMPIQNEGANAIVKIKNNGDKLSTEEIDNLKKLYEERDNQEAKIRIDFLNENPSSIAALWLMEDMLIRSQIEMDVLEKIFKRVDAKKYGKSYFYKAIKDRIDGYKNAAVGAKCPKVFGKNLIDGKQFDLSQLKGKYVLLDFWGTWCGACIAGMPEMKSFADKHADKLELVGLAKDNSEKLVLNMMSKKNITWTNILIGKGESDFVSKFNVQGFPTKILISPRGKIILREVGETKDFYEKVEKLISK